MIDAHHHLWSPARNDYGWLSPDDAALYREFGPQHLEPLINAAGISRTVLVQAAPTVAETRYLLAIAERTDWVAGVVGWVDFENPDVAATLDSLAAHPAFRGVRPMIQDIPDDDWMLGESLTAAFLALIERDLSFDALVLPRHLPRLRRLLERHPTLRTVIDHGAKPAIAKPGTTASDEFDQWAGDIARVAEQTSACCKLSGLATEAAADWQCSDLRPYVAHLIDCFGPERLLWGSDWPVVNLAGGYQRWRRASLDLLAELSDGERAAIFGDNAARFYRLRRD